MSNVQRFWPVVGVLLTTFTSACHAGGTPTHWYGADATAAIYLAWTEDTTGHLQGQLQIVTVDASNPAKLNAVNASFTGTHNGSDISIVFPLLSAYGGATWTGTLRGNSLSLVIPTTSVPSMLVLRPGSFDQFQVIANKLQQSVSTAQRQEAAAQAASAGQQSAYDDMMSARQEVTNAYNETQGVLAEIGQQLPATPGTGSLRTQYAREWQRMQDTWLREQAASSVNPMTCYQKGRVIYISGTMDYEHSEMVYLDSESGDLLQAIQSHVNAANDDIASLQQWAPVYYRRAQSYSGLTGQPLSNYLPGGADPTAKVQAFADAANSDLETYAARVTAFEELVSSYDARASALDKRAKTFANSLGCSG